MGPFLLTNFLSCVVKAVVFLSNAKRSVMGAVVVVVVTENIKLFAIRASSSYNISTAVTTVYVRLSSVSE